MSTGTSSSLARVSLVRLSSTPYLVSILEGLFQTILASPFLLFHIILDPIVLEGDKLSHSGLDGVLKLLEVHLY